MSAEHPADGLIAEYAKEEDTIRTVLTSVIPMGPAGDSIRASALAALDSLVARLRVTEEALRDARVDG